MSSSRSRLAYVGADQQVHIVGSDGVGYQQVTYGEDAGARPMWGLAPTRNERSWPCWSPNGQWLACFQIRTPPQGEAQEAWLSVVEVDGVEEQCLSTLGGGFPIYAQWDAGSQRVAVLSQMEDQLELGICEVGRLGRHHLIEQGVPLFFSWAPDGRRMLVHSGGKQGTARLTLRAVDGNDPDEVYADSPGSFCTPMIVGDQAVYVAQGGGTGILTIADLQGEHVRALAEIDGLVAVVPDPAGERIAYTASPKGDNRPYEGVWLTSLDGTENRRLYEGGCVAFFWSADGRRLLVAARGPRPAGYHWDLVDVETGQVTTLCQFFPSEDQRFFLHFFEQFSTSHSQISPDGRYLVYSAHPDPDGGGADPQARIFLVDMDAPDEPPQEVAPGRFAVFSPV